VRYGYSFPLHQIRISDSETEGGGRVNPDLGNILFLAIELQMFGMLFQLAKRQ